MPTTNWDSERLDAFSAADGLHVAPFRDDGATYGTLTWIWSVVVDGALYVRAYHGRDSRWYRAAIRQKAGRIAVVGDTLEVAFAAVEGDLLDRIDDAYRTRYERSPYLAAMISPRARAATVRIDPRG